MENKDQHEVIRADVLRVFGVDIDKEEEPSGHYPLRPNRAS